MTITKVVESGLVVNKNEETPTSSSEEEPKKGSEEENPATSSDCDKKDSQVRVPKVTITEAVKSDLVVRKKEEPPSLFSEEVIKKRQ